MVTRDASEILVEVALALSVSASALISLRGFFNAKARWRQLRSGAGLLESIIWCYRTRVGDFELRSNEPDSKQPEAFLCMQLNEWLTAPVAASSLQSIRGRKSVHTMPTTMPSPPRP